ncbi:uncharacterized protein LOC108471728 [Gossypium arboreum]|uniref:uncharacterized protein LOC108471728 n=1 Tax=Gossypium arboreum TaxID=29729 RepID=UPI0008190679|nr:uncharacterized protein LOC108471728 [Gossypium arboreum]
MGRMRFRDTHLFNLALLGRQVWRLENFKDTLCFRVLSAKYFPKGDVFRPKRSDKPSFTWMSIAKAAAEIKDGFMWQNLLTNNENKVQDLWDQQQKLWKRGRVMELLVDGRYERCIDWLKDTFRVLDSKAAVDFLMLLWNVWNNRNKLVFQDKDDPAMGTSRDPPKPMCKCWTKPPCGFVKVNVDAAISEGSIGYGVIARDTDSFVFGGSYGVINKTLDIIWAELEALSAGLKFEEAMNFSKIIVESDNALLINTVNKHEDDVTILGCCVNKECRLLNNFVSVRFKWIDRNSNAIADLLSRLAISNNCTLNFKLDYPLGIYNVIIRDAMN